MMNNSPEVWMRKGEDIKNPVQYLGCGLDDIWLVSGYEIEEIDGDFTITVSDLDGLLDAVGGSLVKRKKILTGKEIRFLRKQMDLTQSKLARLVGCDAQQIARYEKGQNKMAGPTDRLLRMIYSEHLRDQTSVLDILEALDELDSRLDERQVFEETAEGWRKRA